MTLKGLTDIAQTRRNPMDRQVNAALRPLIGDARSVQLNPSHLPMVRSQDNG